MTQLSELGRRGCQCVGCERLFWGVPAFDAHRIGTGEARRCANDAEMAKAGLLLDERGVWAWAKEVGQVRRKPPIHPASRARTPGTEKAGRSGADAVAA